MEVSHLAGAALVGILTGAASGWATLLVLGERLRQVENDAARLSKAVEGERGLLVRVGILERK
jgi:hypothetical protein